MTKILAAVLAALILTSTVEAQAVRVPCTEEPMAVEDYLESQGQILLLRLDNEEMETSFFIATNPDTGAWTVVRQQNDLYCNILVGDGSEPAPKIVVDSLRDTF